MSTLCVMSGIPGSGKSTFIQHHYNEERDISISRDAIRFSLVPENEPYFSKENQVYRTYIAQIKAALISGDYDYVFADATQMTPKTRHKLLSKTAQNASKIICIFMDTPLAECLARNENRKGTRAYVPAAQIQKMSTQLVEPTRDEGFDNVYVVVTEG